MEFPYKVHHTHDLALLQPSAVKKGDIVFVTGIENIDTIGDARFSTFRVLNDGIPFYIFQGQEMCVDEEDEGLAVINKYSTLAYIDFRGELLQIGLKNYTNFFGQTYKDTGHIDEFTDITYRLKSTEDFGYMEICRSFLDSRSIFSVARINDNTAYVRIESYTCVPSKRQLRCSVSYYIVDKEGQVQKFSDAYGHNVVWDHINTLNRENVEEVARYKNALDLRVKALLRNPSEFELIKEFFNEVDDIEELLFPVYQYDDVKFYGEIGTHASKYPTIVAYQNNYSVLLSKDEYRDHVRKAMALLKFYQHDCIGIYPYTGEYAIDIGNPYEDGAVILKFHRGIHVSNTQEYNGWHISLDGMYVPADPRNYPEDEERLKLLQQEYNLVARLQQ